MKQLRSFPAHLHPLVVTFLVLLLALLLVSIGTGSNAVFASESDRSEQPQYGGQLNIGTVYYTLSALSWDPADWAWKQNHDTGAVREQLFAADLRQGRRQGGPYAFVADAYIPAAALRGELAQRWEWQQGPGESLRLIIYLRRGIKWPAHANVMAERELDAEDVVFSYNLVNTSPKRITSYFDHIDKVEAIDSHTVVFHFNQYNSEWAYRFGYGYYSAIVPRESASIERKDWRNVTGSGPFMLQNYIQGNLQSYRRNPDYWDTLSIAGKEQALPFIDEIHYRIIKDRATTLAALRTAHIDILEAISWLMVDHLKQSTPELQWARSLSMTSQTLVMRVDRKPFDDVRVRRAMNLAINQQEIAARFYGGHAEVLAYPQHPDFGGYFQALEDMPESVQELFRYKPDKARRLLAEAGYEDGFRFKVQVCSCDPNTMDLLPLLDSYLNKIGVSIEIETLEYGAFLSVMTTRNHAEGYFHGSGHTNPTTTLRKNFVGGELWNVAQYANPEFDRKMAQVFQTRNEATREGLVRELTAGILDEAPHIWLPVQYYYAAWWPWVKNYSGELRAGAVRPGPIYARLWLDQVMKREMGFR